MVVLKIFGIHENYTEELLSQFGVGEHVVGRGSFANCMDKKVSRRHIVINVKDNEATLTLVHISPIFFMSKKSPHIQILKKDNSIILSDGDKFAFLIDTWYTVKIEENQITNENLAGSNSSAAPISNATSSSTVVASMSNTITSQSTSCKRSAEELYSEERKKLKHINESLDKLEDNIDKIISLDHNKYTDDKNEFSIEVVNSNTKEIFKGNDISNSDDEDSDAEMLPEVSCDIEVVNDVQNNSVENSESHNIENKDDDKKYSEILDSMKKEPMIDDDDEELKIKIEPQEVESNVGDDNSGPNSEAEGVSASVKNEDETPLKTLEDNELTRANEEDSADASSTSSRTSNRPTRAKCWYGQNCYRKNSSHKDQFSHPGDADHGADSDDDIPQCPYGAHCYRRNPQHRKAFKHPTSRPAPGPSTSNRNKRKRNVNYQPDMDYDSDSLDEGDPFSADESSTASEVFESGDSDSDYMEDPNFDNTNDSEEVRILFKEAKKFLRKKRSD